jgi:hypothetical protein
MSIFFTIFIRLVKVTWTVTSGQFLLFNLQYADHMDAEPSSAPTLPSRVPSVLSRRMDTNSQVTCITGTELATHLVQGSLSNGYKQIPKLVKPQPYCSVVPHSGSCSSGRQREREREREGENVWCSVGTE